VNSESCASPRGGEVIDLNDPLQYYMRLCRFIKSTLLVADSRCSADARSVDTRHWRRVHLACGRSVEGAAPMAEAALNWDRNPTQSRCNYIQLLSIGMRCTKGANTSVAGPLVNYFHCGRTGALFYNGIHTWVFD
jgi:hypothetical protein